MTNKSQPFTRVGIYIMVSGAIISVCFAGFAGLGSFFSALFGASIAFANWRIFQWFGKMLLSPTGKKKYGFLLGIKTVLTLTVISILLLLFQIERLPFMAGFSALIIGIVFGGAAAMRDSGEDHTTE